MGTPLKFEFDFDEVFEGIKQGVIRELSETNFDEAKESAINQIKSEVKEKLALTYSDEYALKDEIKKEIKERVFDKLIKDIDDKYLEQFEGYIESQLTKNPDRLEQLKREIKDGLTENLYDDLYHSIKEEVIGQVRETTTQLCNLIGGNSVKVEGSDKIISKKEYEELIRAMLLENLESAKYIELVEDEESANYRKMITDAIVEDSIEGAILSESVKSVIDGVCEQKSIDEIMQETANGLMESVQDEVRSTIQETLDGGLTGIKELKLFEAVAWVDEFLNVDDTPVGLLNGMVELQKADVEAMMALLMQEDFYNGDLLYLSAIYKRLCSRQNEIILAGGNAQKLEQEIISWMPNFESYHFLDKASMGFMDTMRHLLTSGNLLFLCYLILLAVFVFLKAKQTAFRAAAVFPVFVTVWISWFPNAVKANFPAFWKLVDKGDFICGSNYHMAANYIPVVLFLCVVGCMLLSLTAVCESLTELLAQLYLLALGLATRVVMGFTPTIYVSQERTFLFLYMILGISAAYLVVNHQKTLKENRNIWQTMKAAGVTLAVLGVLLDLAEIGSF